MYFGIDNAIDSSNNSRSSRSTTAVSAATTTTRAPATTATASATTATAALAAKGIKINDHAPFFFRRSCSGCPPTAAATAAPTATSTAAVAVAVVVQPGCACLSYHRLLLCSAFLGLSALDTVVAVAAVSCLAIS